MLLPYVQQPGTQAGLATSCQLHVPLAGRTP
eukprot:COSAG01_NODE_60421_length_295_cov_0.413265_1_plen_30_part_10